MELKDKQFLTEMFHINIVCENNEIISWEEIDGVITNDQTNYLIELLLKHNLLPTEEPIRNITVVSNTDGVDDIIDVFPTDIDGDMVEDENGVTICPVILVSKLSQLN